MSEPSIIDEKAKEIYETHREELEKLYQGKIIAIDIDENSIVAVGEYASEVGLEAKKKRPHHRIFMRRVGKNPSVVRLKNRKYV
ncbi:hypothetical protein ANME2D_01593 [Candidatus Methanoperedens nitroreducens]|uniref:DUF5678 domain-containing protein n=1 Tax=Candidatus Methanoperedens nitratireducens TaxID=1392998 RepID=A0A062V8U6_9EURY|nr:hypothetical protein [Candidatus Methanoperedens nitroreducens]KCZ72189.1 hypothetical protein ANME2D_01593 [Candidatus Methanoperedens nitroreducens]MDJ1421834.1 hypothetical protein [Candidatus Methanoperedens sp.]